MGRTFSYSWSSSGIRSLSNYDEEFSSRRKPQRQYGIPTECYCNEDIVLKICPCGSDKGRRYYGCKKGSAGGCVITKWWDKVLMEELELMKQETEGLESRVDELNQIFHDTSKYDDLKDAMEGMVAMNSFIEAENKTKAMKEMRILTLVALFVALVTVLFCVTK